MSGALLALLGTVLVGLPTAIAAIRRVRAQNRRDIAEARSLDGDYALKLIQAAQENVVIGDQVLRNVRIQLDEQTRQLADQAAQLQECQAGLRRMEELNRRIEELERDLALATGRVEDLEHQLEVVTAERDQLRADNVELRRRVDQLERRPDA